MNVHFSSSPLSIFALPSDHFNQVSDFSSNLLISSSSLTTSIPMTNLRPTRGAKKPSGGRDDHDPDRVDAEKKKKRTYKKKDKSKKPTPRIPPVPPVVPPPPQVPPRPTMPVVPPVLPTNPQPGDSGVGDLFDTRNPQLITEFLRRLKDAFSSPSGPPQDPTVPLSDPSLSGSPLGDLSSTPANPGPTSVPPTTGPIDVADDPSNDDLNKFLEDFNNQQLAKRLRAEDQEREALEKKMRGHGKERESGGRRFSIPVPPPRAPEPGPSYQRPPPPQPQPGPSPRGPKTPAKRRGQPRVAPETGESTGVVADDDDYEVDVPMNENDEGLPNCVRCSKIPVGCCRYGGIACIRCSNLKTICLPVSDRTLVTYLSN